MRHFTRLVTRPSPRPLARSFGAIHQPARVIKAADVDSLAAELLKPNMRIVTAMAACEPKLFFENFGRWLQADESLTNIVTYCANPNEPYPVFLNQSLAGRLKLITLFLTAAVRN